MSTSQQGQEVQPGFSFNPGQLIPQAPLVFPGESDLFQLLEITAAYAGYFGVVGEVIAVIAEIIVLILDLIDELVSLFSGKPRAQDTLTVAKRLGHGNSPIAHLMSVQLYRNLNQNNIVLSSSDPGDQKILAAIRKQAEGMLETLGTPSARAIQLVGQVWGNTTSSTEKLPAELNTPLPQGFVMVGTQEFQQLYIDEYNADIQKGDDPLKAAKKATNWCYQHGKMADLNKISILPQPQVGGQQCPDGQTWNPITQMCQPNQTGTGGGSGKAPCPPYDQLPDCFPPPPAPDDSLDEIGDLAQLSAWGSMLIALAILNVYQAITQLVPVTSTGGAAPPTVNVTVEPAPVTIEALPAPVVNVTVDNTGAGGAPIDLSHLNADADADVAARELSTANHALITAKVTADAAALAQGLA